LHKTNDILKMKELIVKADILTENNRKQI